MIKVKSKMEKINWFYNRLRGMSLEEIVWRIKSQIISFLDIFKVLMHLYPSEKKVIQQANSSNTESIIFSGTLKEQDSLQSYDDQWHISLITTADKILNYQLSFFDMQNVFIGNPIKWQKDHSSGKESTLKLIQFVDYRDFNNVGDCKLVWEPNRHHHLVVLARAYAVTKQKKYASAVLQQLDAWMDQNPFGYGMNWRSPLELGVRLINWVWAIDLIKSSGLFTGEIKERILHFAYLHCWDITRKYSKGSSANNHLVGEAAGIFIATSYFYFFQNASQWRSEAKKILAAEIKNQVFADGCIREQALGYQFFVLQFYIYSGIAARWSGDDFSSDYWATVQKMLMFIAKLTEAGNDLPMFGDKDDGYVLDLGNNPTDVKALLGVGAVLFEDGYFKALSQSSETLFWLYGNKGIAVYDSIVATELTELDSMAFTESGHYLMQCGNYSEDNTVSILFDCGQLGFGSIAAHGHADALSLTLRVGGEQLLLDSGTYDYFTHPTWRNYFRSTMAHNTIVVDGLDQSEMLGLFLWGKKAEASCIHWLDEVDSVEVSGEHSGYLRLDNPVKHVRKIHLNKKSKQVTVDDSLLCEGNHQMVMCWHFAPKVILTKEANHSYRATLPNGKNALFSFDSTTEIEIFTGGNNNANSVAWYSDRYHNKVAINSVVCKKIFKGNSHFKTKIELI